jgi:hypothetical protein
MPYLNTEILDSFLLNLEENKTEYNTFIESGTYYGGTVTALRDEFQTLYTIELSEKHYQYFDEIKRSNNYDNIVNYFGDTVDVLPVILQTLKYQDKSIFWLDGHWSSGDTAKGKKDCPLIEECNHIDNFYKPSKGIILIDDYRLFGTFANEDWSDISLDKILLCFMKHNVSHKIINDVLVVIIEKV